MTALVDVTTAGFESNAQLAMNNRGPSFDTRADLLTWIAGSNASTIPEGLIVFGGGLGYRRKSGATDIPDMPDWVPVWPCTTDHFPGPIAARQWSEDNNVLIQDLNADPTGSSWKIGLNFKQNNNFSDAAFSVQRTKYTSGAGEHAISGVVNLESPDNIYAGAYAGSFQAYNAASRSQLGPGEFGPEACGLRSGCQIRGREVDGVEQPNPNGHGRAAIFEMALPVDNQNAEIDGHMTGLELATKNYGGSEVDEIDTADPHRKVNLLFAQARHVTSQYAGKNTAMMYNGSAGPGWYYGWAASQIHKDYLNFKGPLSPGARALNVRPDENWDESVVALPAGTGIGVWNSDETVLSNMVTGDADSLGAAKFPTGIRLGNGQLLTRYEEDVWTAEIMDQSGNTSPTTASGTYTVVGNLCTAFFALMDGIDITDMVPTDTAVLTLPLPATGPSSTALAISAMSSTSGSPNLIYLDVSLNSSHGFIRGCGFTGTRTQQKISDVANAVIQNFCITYQV